MGLKFGNFPNGLAFICKVPGAGWFRIAVYCPFCEASGGFGCISDGSQSAARVCGWKPPLPATSDAELRRKRLDAELANGRLVTIAIIGVLFQDGFSVKSKKGYKRVTFSGFRKPVPTY